MENASQLNCQNAKIHQPLEIRNKLRFPQTFIFIHSFYSSQACVVKIAKRQTWHFQHTFKLKLFNLYICTALSSSDGPVDVRIRPFLDRTAAAPPSSAKRPVQVLVPNFPNAGKTSQKSSRQKGHSHPPEPKAGHAHPKLVAIAANVDQIFSQRAHANRLASQS